MCIVSDCVSIVYESSGSLPAPFKLLPSDSGVLPVFFFFFSNFTIVILNVSSHDLYTLIFLFIYFHKAYFKLHFQMPRNHHLLKSLHNVHLVYFSIVQIGQEPQWFHFPTGTFMILYTTGFMSCFSIHNFSACTTTFS